jgi:hypothetical protein
MIFTSENTAIYKLYGLQVASFLFSRKFINNCIHWETKVEKQTDDVTSGLWRLPVVVSALLGN